jgi:hypothetical protein
VIQGKLPDLFIQKNGGQDLDQKALVEDLYKSIGKLKVENDWLKKN